MAREGKTINALVSGWGFDVVTAPTVTAGAYSAGDIMGGLLTFAGVAQYPGQPVVVTGVQVALKAAVAPALTLVLFSADPTNTTKTDNAAYSLAAADAFKVLAAISVSTLYDHGTPNTYANDGLNLVVQPVASAIYGLLVDGTGVTLASTGDVQVRLRGRGV